MKLNAQKIREDIGKEYYNYNKQLNAEQHSFTYQNLIDNECRTKKGKNFIMIISLSFIVIILIIAIVVISMHCFVG